MIVMFGNAKQLQQAVVEAVELHFKQAQGGIKELFDKFRSVEQLNKQISDLTIDWDRKVEEWARKEREVEHKIGLERKRQEFEIAQAKRETTVAVREDNLAADRERFKSEMEFQRKHLEGEIGSLRTLVGQMLERLPSAEIFHEVKGKR